MIEIPYQRLGRPIGPRSAIWRVRGKLIQARMF